MTENEYYEELTKSEKNISKVICGYKYDSDYYSGFKYRFIYHNMYHSLCEKFDLRTIAGNGSVLDQALNLMNWITKRTYYCGYSNLRYSDLYSIINYSFDKGWDGAINCEHKSILLQECLIALRHFAHLIVFENYKTDKEKTKITSISCHVCIHLFLPENDKWVLLDPSFNAYFTDENNNVLNIIEIQNILIENKKINLANYSLNGTDIYKNEYPINFIYNKAFRISLHNGNLENDKVYNQNMLFPIGIDKTSYYRMKQLANGISKSDINQSIDAIRYISVTELLGKPSWV